MQLFITPAVCENEMITLEEPRVVTQMGKVLRMKQGDRCCVQIQDAVPVTRYTIEITEITKKYVQGKILEVEEASHLGNGVGMAVALPNKPAKSELIVQKLSEMGINRILFWVAERSQLRDISPSKQERLEKIALEATEQSWGWTLPSIEVCEVSDMQSQYENIVVADVGGIAPSDMKKFFGDVLGVVGPEGGFTQKDYETWGVHERDIMGLGNQIYRMETAAIICGRTLKNIVMRSQ